MTTQIIFGTAGDQSQGDMIPVLVFDTNLRAEVIAPVAANTVSTIVAPATRGNPMCVVSTDTAVYVALGAAPDATVANRRVFVPAGRMWAMVCYAGDKAAVVAAA